MILVSRVQRWHLRWHYSSTAIILYYPYAIPPGSDDRLGEVIHTFQELSPPLANQQAPTTSPGRACQSHLCDISSESTNSTAPITYGSRSLNILACKIYAVTNPYRNIIQAALPGRLDRSHRGLLSPTGICRTSRTEHRRGGLSCTVLDHAVGEPDEVEETASADEGYEPVPVHFLRCVT